MTAAGPPPPTRRSLRTGEQREPATGELLLPPAHLEIEVPPLAHDAAATPAMIAAASFDSEADAAPETAPRPAAPTSVEAPVPASPPARIAEPVPAAAAEREAGDSVPVVLPPVTAALAWVDERTVSGARPALALDAVGAASFTPATADLLARAPRRTPWRPGVLVPIGVIVAVIAAYCGTTLLWPLHAVAPEVAQSIVEPVPAPAAVGAWPAAGGAAVSVDGISTPIASNLDARSIASITKVVTALVVLDEMPLAPGEQGPEFRFTAADRAQYWRYRGNGESALDVPVGGTLTQLQMLQGTLIGSANNYADRLASAIWPNDTLFARAANDWLAAHGVTGITIADPTGIDADNIASPDALLVLAQRALADPVIAEIVRTPSIELPGAGLVENSNPLLADPGVVGIKTGTLDAYNLLAAKDVTVGDTTVRVYASMLGQPDRDTRDAATRALFSQVEQELQLSPSVAADTVVGRVETRWGATAPIVTASDASVVLWNGAAASVASTFDLGDAREPGEVVGSLVATGPKNTASVDLVLDGEIADPSAWWRLTHPLELFGLA